MKDNRAIEQHGLAQVLNFLNSRPESLAVVDVQESTEFQAMDIDFVWLRHHGTQVDCPSVEVKVCTPYTTTNFFFEIVSNSGKHTPGAVIYSFSRYLFYLFYYRKELYILPTQNVRLWLLKNWDTIETRETKTPVREGQHYVTIGKMVEEQRVLEIPGVKKFSLSYDLHPTALERLAQYEDKRRPR